MRMVPANVNLSFDLEQSGSRAVSVTYEDGAHITHLCDYSRNNGIYYLYTLISNFIYIHLPARFTPVAESSYQVTNIVNCRHKYRKIA